jgi:hypothetical protein
VIYTEIHKKFLQRHEKTPRKELVKLFNAEFGTDVPYKALSQKCTKMGLVCPNGGCFSKGHVSYNKGTKGIMKPNKTSYKRGNLPHNTKKVGTITTVNDKNGYLYMRIKIAEPNKWQMLHAYIWEQKHGQIPKGYCVIFKDKNSLNLKPHNLMLVSRAELARLNQKYANIDESLKETALQVVKVSNAINKKSKEMR